MNKMTEPINIAEDARRYTVKLEDVPAGEEAIRSAEEEKVRAEMMFPWARALGQSVRETSYSFLFQTVLKNLRLFHSEVRNEAENGEIFTRPRRALRLKFLIENYISLVHVQYDNLDKKPSPAERSEYLGIVAELVSLLIDLKIRITRPGSVSLKKMAQDISACLFSYLRFSLEDICDAILKCKYFSRKQSELCKPILKGVLTRSTFFIPTAVSYFRFTLAFRLWRKLETAVPDRRNVTKIAEEKLRPSAEIVHEAKTLQGVSHLLEHIDIIPNTTVFLVANTDSDFADLKKAFLDTYSCVSTAAPCVIPRPNGKIYKPARSEDEIEIVPPPIPVPKPVIVLDDEDAEEIDLTKDDVASSLLTKDDVTSSLQEPTQPAMPEPPRHVLPPCAVVIPAPRVLEPKVPAPSPPPLAVIETPPPVGSTQTPDESPPNNSIAAPSQVFEVHSNTVGFEIPVAPQDPQEEVDKPPTPLEMSMTNVPTMETVSIEPELPSTTIEDVPPQEAVEARSPVAPDATVNNIQTVPSHMTAPTYVILPILPFNLASQFTGDSTSVSTASILKRKSVDGLGVSDSCDAPNKRPRVDTEHLTCNSPHLRIAMAPVSSLTPPVSSADLSEYGMAPITISHAQDYFLGHGTHTHGTEEENYTLPYFDFDTSSDLDVDDTLRINVMAERRIANSPDSEFTHPRTPSHQAQGKVDTSLPNSSLPLKKRVKGVVPMAAPPQENFPSHQQQRMLCISQLPQNAATSLPQMSAAQSQMGSTTPTPTQQLVPFNRSDTCELTESQVSTAVAFESLLAKRRTHLISSLRLALGTELPNREERCESPQMPQLQRFNYNDVRRQVPDNNENIDEASQSKGGKGKRRRLGKSKSRDKHSGNTVSDTLPACWLDSPSVSSESAVTTPTPVLKRGRGRPSGKKKAEPAPPPRKRCTRLSSSEEESSTDKSRGRSRRLYSGTREMVIHTRSLTRNGIPLEFPPTGKS